MATQASNFEEAAAIAQEFIYSLDNLPNEVSHLLQEIKYRETRAFDLQQEIDKDTAKYIRYSKKSIPSPSTPPALAGSRDSSPKSTVLPNKINASYAEIQELTAEKCALAKRLIEALSRTRARLDDDLVKVRTLQGENVDTPALVPRALMSTTVGTNNIAVASGDPAQALSDSLRNALGSTSSLDSRGLSGTSTPVPTATSANGTTTKKRRVTTTNSSIKISPASPVKKRSASPSTTAAQTHTSHPKSRLSRQVHPASEDGDMDAEGEEDMDGDDDNEDETLYCFCQRTSYGDMIACDNEGGCPYEWFHLPCVGLKLPTPEKWYCDHCEKHVTSPPTATTAPAPRKGRKK